MHKIEMPQWIIDRVMERRGMLHCHANVDPRKTALIVIDLQNCFMVQEMATAYVPSAIEIVPAVNRLAAAVRETGGKVFWIKNIVNDDTLTSWSEWFALMRGKADQAAQRVGYMKLGSRGHDLHSDLIVEPNDQIVLKQRFSAFIQGSSELPELLRAQGLDTVVITGTVSNICCESSARDAMMLNFKTIFVNDANAALTDEEHSATLVSLYSSFADVMDTDFLIGCLRKNAGIWQAAE